MKLNIKRYQVAAIFVAMCGLAVFGNLRLRPGARVTVAKPIASDSHVETKPATKGTSIKATPSAGGLDIPQSVIASGGDTSIGGALSLTGTIGQPLVGTSTGGAFTLTSGFMTEVSPDLTVTKTNNVGGTTTTGNSWTWTLHVAVTDNQADFADGLAILSDSLPNENISYGSVAVANATGVTGTINCTIGTNDLSCVASGAVSVAAGGSFDIQFTATPSGAGTYANPRSGGSCSVDPNNVVSESDETNNSCTDTVTVTGAGVTTVYTDPAGVCGGNTPCFTTINAAIAAAGAGGVVMVGPGTYSESVNLNINVTLNITGDISITGIGFSAGVINGGSAVISVAQGWSNSGGTFNAQSSTVNMNGVGIPGGIAPVGPVTNKFKPNMNFPQPIGGNNTFNNLTIDDPVGVQFGGDQTVTGVLTLTSGLVNINSNTLILTSTATVNRTTTDPQNGYLILGSVTKQAISGSFSFPVGDFTGFTPLDTANASGGGDFTVLPVSGTQPSLNASTSLAEYWTLTATGSVTLDMTFNYQPGDVNGDESQYRIIRVEGGTAVTFGTSVPGVSYDTVNHTATITGVSHFSDWTLGQSVTPTAVNLDSFTAVSVSGGALLQWKTGLEVNNLGFNIYRQTGGDRVQINPTLIAGTALMVGGDVTLKSGYSYSWSDNPTDPNTSYWLEDVDLNGTSTWHGPFGISSAARDNPSRSQSLTLSQLNSVAQQTNAVIVREYAAQNGNSTAKGTASQLVTNGRTPTRPASISAALQKQWQIASQAAIKIAVNKTGWYKVNAADLITAGFNANTNPANLQMFVGGIEVPIRTNSTDGIHLDSIEFYGMALDTPTSDTQIYWLVPVSGTGKRIGAQQSLGSNNGNSPSSFEYTIERKDRSLYFSSLRNGDTENWLGPVVATSPVSQTINVHNRDVNASGQAQLEVALQGVTTSTHQVTISLNGQAINTTTFDGMDHHMLKLSVPESSLIEGNNQITFAAQSSGDVSLIDYVRITYSHTYAADNNGLSATVTGTQPVKITGFTSNQIRAIDAENANQPIELEGTIDGVSGNYSITVDGAKRRNLLVFTPDKILQPLSITANHPSTISNAGNGADFVIITNSAFAASLQPLVALRQSQGYQVKVVDIDNVYDEFNYGVHSPYAVRSFLGWTYTHWQRQPQFVMFAGSGTIDPRNYSGVGFMDFVPTKLIDTSSMETASDDWFVDFNSDGKPQMSIGRLPVRTPADATLVVSKIIAYEQSAAVPQTMVLVSDLNDGIDFNSANNQIRQMVPSNLSVVNITRGQNVADSKAVLLNQLNQGGGIVNYAGHGSVNLWRGGLLTDDDMVSLANHKVSPLVVTMTCLNGYFQDPKLASLGESLLRVNQGGAVSVWASSAMTDAGNQNALNQAFFQRLFSNPTITIGEAIKAAKSATNDNDIRRTWILFGDPTMRIKR